MAEEEKEPTMSSKELDKLIKQNMDLKEDLGHMKDLEKTNKQQQAELKLLQEQLASTQRELNNSMLSNRLTSMNCVDNELVLEILSNRKVEPKDFDEAITKLKEEKAYLFVDEKPKTPPVPEAPKISGNTPVKAPVAAPTSAVNTEVDLKAFAKQLADEKNKQAMQTFAYKRLIEEQFKR